jgi:hypothetical protein
MTPEQNRKAVAWLSAHWANRNCPIHGATTWNVDKWLGEVRTFGGGSLFVGKGQVIFPLLVVTCGICGYTIFFNAIMAGVVQASDKDTPGAAEPPKGEAG